MSEENKRVRPGSKIIGAISSVTAHGNVVVDRLARRKVKELESEEIEDQSMEKANPSVMVVERALHDNRARGVISELLVRDEKGEPEMETFRDSMGRITRRPTGRLQSYESDDKRVLKTMFGVDYRGD